VNARLVGSHRDRKDVLDGWMDGLMNIPRSLFFKKRIAGAFYLLPFHLTTDVSHTANSFKAPINDLHVQCKTREGKESVRR
jgi:hypothetical protein